MVNFSLAALFKTQILFLIFSTCALADIKNEDVLDRQIANESEVGFVSLTGNSKSESFTVKQLNAYKWDKNLARFDGRYLRSTTSDIETASRWLLGLRYEREVHDRMSLFLGQNAESDRFAEIDRRYNTDAGLKYFMIRTKGIEWFAELGYRYTTLFQIRGETQRFNQGRLYTQYTEDFSEYVSGKAWVEYVPNFTVEQSYLINSEFSVSAALSKILSLKTAYLINYNNAERAGVRERTDTTTTVTLVAKF